MDELWTTAVRELSVAALLMGFLMGFVRKWWVLGWHYDETVKDRDEWKELALQNLRIAEKAVNR